MQQRLYFVSQGGKTPASKPYDLSSSPRVHMIRVRNQFLKVVFQACEMTTIAHAPPPYRPKYVSKCNAFVRNYSSVQQGNTPVIMLPKIGEEARPSHQNN